MKILQSLNANLDYGNHWGPSDVDDKIADRIKLLSDQGYKIFVGNNPGVLHGKGFDGMDVILISQTNHPTSGSSLRTIWAVK